MVCLFVPDFVWQDVRDLLDPNHLQTLKAGGREGERLALAYESLIISKNTMHRHLEMLLVSIGRERGGGRMHSLGKSK